MVGPSSASVWRRRNAKTISQSARWHTISAALHLPGARGMSILLGPIASRQAAMTPEVAAKIASIGRPSRKSSYGLSWLIGLVSAEIFRLKNPSLLGGFLLAGSDIICERRLVDGSEGADLAVFWVRRGQLARICFKHLVSAILSCCDVRGRARVPGHCCAEPQVAFPLAERMQDWNPAGKLPVHLIQALEIERN